MQSSSATGSRGERLFGLIAPMLVGLLLVAGVVLADGACLLAAVIGMVGTAVFLWGTWTIVKLAGSAASLGKPSPVQVAVTVVALLMKLPLIYVGWVVAKGLGPFGPTWFLLGLGLVYFLVIWRAVLAVRA